MATAIITSMIAIILIREIFKTSPSRYNVYARQRYPDRGIWMSGLRW
jgi:hypothetical protein